MSSYHALPTVRVVSPTASGGFMVINRSDLNDGHELWPGELPNPAPIETEEALSLRILARLMAQKDGVALEDWQGMPGAERIERLRAAEAEITAAVAHAPRKVAKGPGGRWFVVRMGERVSAGFPDEAAAKAEMARLDEADA